MDGERWLASARRTLAIEARGLSTVAAALDRSFVAAVTLILRTDGRLVVTGMGKSGLVGRKIAATCASVGTPSYFLHPGEAWHGDLGMVTPADVVLAVSYSGETEECVRLLPFLQQNGNALIAMTGNNASTLAQAATAHIFAGVDEEACPYQLAPTASTTAALALGDALALALMEARGFAESHFARFHPGGSLGKRLLWRVADVMRKADLPTVAIDAPITAAIAEMTRGGCGTVVVVDTQRTACGIITDGDLRRALTGDITGFADKTAAAVMTRQPRTIASDARLEEAKDLMNAHNITCLVVTDATGAFCGLVQLFDCEI